MNVQMKKLFVHPGIHPHFMTRIGRLIRSKQTYLKKESVLVLVCGAETIPGSHKITRRDLLIDYGKRHLRSFRFFQAEQVFAALTAAQDTDLLSVEDQLSSFSDCIILILESPGTLAELGAFAIKDSIAAISLVINDKQFERRPSFVNRGPLEKIRKVSKFGEPIFVDLQKLLVAASDIQERLKRVTRKRVSRVDISTHENYVAAEPKSRALFLADLIALMSPITFKELVALLRNIYDTDAHIPLDLEIGILRALGLVHKHGDFFVRSLEDRGLFFYYVGLKETRFRCEVVNYFSKYARARMAPLAELAQEARVAS